MGRQLAQFDDFAVVCDVTLAMPMSTALRRLMAAEAPPNRGGRPDTWMQVRRDQLRPRVVRAVGRGASSLNSTILLWFVM